jgi:hypothetical protein
LTGFKQHRESLRSKWIDRLGEFVDVIKNQCNDNTNLKEQLEDVKAVINLNQENIQASEVKKTHQYLTCCLKPVKILQSLFQKPTKIRPVV